MAREIFDGKNNIENRRIYDEYLCDPILRKLHVMSCDIICKSVTPPNIIVREAGDMDYVFDEQTAFLLKKVEDLYNEHLRSHYPDIKKFLDSRKKS